MGNTDSKQKLGERVIAARIKLDQDIKIQSKRCSDIESKSPETMKVIIQSVSESFKSYSPFLEPTLLIAWHSNPKKCKEIIINSCKKLLSEPIIGTQYQWFKQYVFTSSIWMFKIKENRFMYQELMDIANNMSHDIIVNMNSIYNHLQFHPKWNELMNIKNKSIVSRQDDKRVGLLQEKGIRNVLEVKDDDNDDIDGTLDDMQSFIDSNLAINILSSTAKTINDEFQNHIKTIMSRYGDVKPGPLKKVERCLSKLENDYQDAQYPKAAKLLDLVRCSVTFNVLEQLIAGYNGLIRHIQKNSTIIELARIKNGFLDKNYDGGYRDIKINVIYHSAINIGVSMVVEIQLLLGQYLYEKKRIHKLYSILREQLYFDMIIKDSDKEKTTKNMKDLQFEKILDIKKEVEIRSNRRHLLGKCSVDSDLRLLGIEAGDGEYFFCVDMDEKNVIFEEKLELSCHAPHSHKWLSIDNKKYIAVQTEKNIIKMFKIKKNNNNNNKKYTFKEDKTFRLCLKKQDKIYNNEFDKTFDNIFIVKNGSFLEKRSIKNINEVMVSIKFKKKIVQSAADYKQLSLSNDGKFCVFGAGQQQNYFYLIDIENKIQHKLTSNVLKETFVPCFINGDTQYVALTDRSGNIEIWDIINKKPTRVITLDSRKPIWCTHSTNNILAVGSCDGMLRLWDVRNWEMFYSEKYDVRPISIHLTDDSKYLTIAGMGGEKCIVLQIK